MIRSSWFMTSSDRMPTLTHAFIASGCEMRCTKARATL